MTAFLALFSQASGQHSLMLPGSSGQIHQPTNPDSYVPSTNLFYMCKKGCDFELTMKGLKGIRLGENGLFSEFPSFFIHSEELQELKDTSDFKKFTSLIKKGTTHLKTELDKAGRLKDLVNLSVLKEEKRAEKNGTKIKPEKVIENLALAIAKESGAQADDIEKEITKYCTKIQSESNNLNDVLLSEGFYNHIKSTILLPQVDKLLNRKTLSQQFKALVPTTDNSTKERLKQQFEEMVSTSLTSEPFEDRKVKTQLSLNQVPFILTNGHRNKNTRAGLAGLSYGPHAIIFNIDSLSDQVSTKHTRPATHEAMHLYDAKHCTQAGMVMAPQQTPCGNNVKTDPSLPEKTLLAFNLDFQKFKSHVNQVNEKIQQGHKYPLKFIDTTNKLHNSFAQTEHLITQQGHELAKPKQLSAEVFPYLTQEFTPKEILKYAPNCAYIRSFTIHDDGRDSTRLYMNLLQGNTKSATNLIEKDPSILDKQYDGMKLIDVARALKKYDTLLSKGVKLNDHQPNQYTKMVESVNNMYAGAQKKDQKVGILIEPVFGLHALRLQVRLSTNFSDNLDLA